MDVMPKKFPPEFKRDVVTAARRGDLTVPEVAVDFDVSVESVRRWCARPTSMTGSFLGRFCSVASPDFADL
jgi:transposase-like protein